MECSECKQVYSTNRILQLHKQKVHNLRNHEYDLDKKQKIPCVLCKKEFSTQFSLNRHNKIVHKIKSGSQNESRLMCPYVGCDNKLSNFKFLRGHLLIEHDVQIHLEVLEFTSLEDFYKWKSQVEMETLARYTLDTSPKKLPSKIEKRYYGCHRSYNYRPRGNGLRSLKHMGSSKTGKACPARMDVTIKNNDKEDIFIKVNFFKTHLGHSLELDHITLDKDSKKKIRGMIQHGYTFDQILDHVKKSPVIKSGLNKRLSLIGKKDLHNLAKARKNKHEAAENSDSNVFDADESGQQLTIIKCNEDDNKHSAKYNNVEEQEVTNMDISSNVEHLSGDRENEVWILVEEPQNLQDINSSNNKIIEKTNRILDMCNQLDISNDKCELILKHLDKIVNILNTS